MRNFLFFLILLFPGFTFAQVAKITDLSGIIKVNHKIAAKNMVLKEGDKIEAHKNSHVIILYANHALEILRNSKITISQNRADKLLKIQKEAEAAKENVSIKGSESVPHGAMTPRQKEIEKVTVLFANKKYRELIDFMLQSRLNYQHPDLLFKIAFSYFQLGDFFKASNLLEKLLSFDYPEYNELAKSMLVACDYFKTGRKPQQTVKWIEVLN